ncbi:MAG: dipeptidase [Candidatus Asgardarchaeia archaeon]
MFNLSKDEEEHAINLFKESIVIDGLNASIMYRGYFEKMNRSGVTAVNYTVAMNQDISETIKRFSYLHSQIKKSNDLVMLATTAEDVLRAKQERKTAIFFGFQNIAPLEGSLDMLDIYYLLGLRILQLTYHFQNIAGCGGAERHDSGLTKFGIALVEKMNKMHMLIDLAHVGPKTSLETIELSKDPVIFSHSNARALVDEYQNHYDEELKALAEKGGVIGITAFPRMLGKDNCTIEDMLKHIQYVVDLIGVDHVGIGSDFAEGWAESLERRIRLLEIDGKIYSWPKGFEDVTKFVNIAKGLVAYGFSDSEIKKILGENFLRVFKQVFRK